MLGRKNNVKTILEKDTCVYARTRMNLHLHAFFWDVPSGTYEHLFSTLVRRRTAEAHPPPPPAPESRLWLPIGPRSLSLTADARDGRHRTLLLT